jgi:hypothetical protein
LTEGRIRINPEDVVHETVDGEVILISLQTGSYYSLEGSGAQIWAALLDGRCAAEVIAELEAGCRAEPGAIRNAVLDLVEELMAERLVEPDGPGVEEPAQRPEAPAGAVPFVPPVFHKFTDMQDFLLVDPIHEVGEAGWPHSPAVR